MINGETGSLSMDVKVPLDRGVRSQQAALPLLEVWGGDKNLDLDKLELKAWELAVAGRA